MSTPRSKGVLTFSILLESGRSAPPADVTSPNTGHASRLIDIFTRHKIPATWAICRPWQHPLSGRILEGSVRHELALLGDRAWGERPVGRVRTAMELSRRIGLSREVGVEITSTVLLGSRQAAVHAVADILATEQVKAVWQLPGASTSHSNSRPVQLRDGLWHTPASAEVAASQGWLASTRQRIAWRKTFQQIADTGGYSHLWVDAAAVQASGGWLAAVETAVESAATAQNTVGLRIAALGETADLLDAAPKATPSQSILKAA